MGEGTTRASGSSPGTGGKVSGQWNWAGSWECHLQVPGRTGVENVSPAESVLSYSGPVSYSSSSSSSEDVDMDIDLDFAALSEAADFPPGKHLVQASFYRFL